MNSTEAGAFEHAPGTTKMSAYLWTFALVFVVLASSRTFRGSQKGHLLPTLAPIEIFVTSTCLSAGGFRLKLLHQMNGMLTLVQLLFRRHSGSLFGVTSSHQVIHQLKGVDRFLSQPFHTLDNEPLGWSMYLRVFGSEGSAELREKLGLAKKELFVAVERGFMNEAASMEMITRADVPGKTASLVTLSPDPEDIKTWERSVAHRLLVPETAEQAGAAEVDLFNLMRDFGACIAIPLLYGSDLIKRYPQVLDDIWAFDNDAFPLLMVGIPSWAPFKVMKHGIAGRTRLLKEMAALFERIDKYQKGEHVDSADMSDVGQVALDRNAAFSKHGFSYRQRGDSDMALLWGSNANTQPMIFWFIAYIYSTPGLLSALREEMAPHVTVSKTNPPQITSFNYSALSKECPLLKSAYFETFRLANEASSLRCVSKPITIDDGPHTHHLQPGTFITVPHHIVQRDASIYPEPAKFVPERFLETDEVTGKKVARYGGLKPWGAGYGGCKGRVFAEKEILGVAASIVSLWDFEPVGGKWKVPDMLPGTGVMVPAGRMRVIARRRVVA